MSDGRFHIKSMRSICDVCLGYVSYPDVLIVDATDKDSMCTDCAVGRGYKPPKVADEIDLEAVYKFLEDLAVECEYITSHVRAIDKSVEKLKQRISNHE